MSLTGGKIFAALHGVKLNSAEDWDVYQDRIKDVVTMYELEEAFTLTFVDPLIEDDAKNKTTLSILDTDDPNALTPERVLNLTSSYWTSFTNGLQPDVVKMRKQSYAVVSLTLADSMLHLKTGRRDPVVLWARIRQEMEGPTIHRFLMTNRKLWTLQLESFNNDFAKYAAEVDKLCGRLRGLGREIDDESKVSALVNGLPEDQFNGIITVVTNLPELKFQDVVARIKAHLSRKDTNTDSIANLNYGKPKCNYCGKLGHRENRCFKKRRDLRQKIYEQKQQEEKTDKMQYISDTDPLWMISSQPTPKSKMSNFVLDNGAVRSTFKDKHLFKDISPDDRYISYADGTRTKTSGRGTVEMVTPTGELLTIKNVAYVPSVHNNYVSESQLEDQGYYVEKNRLDQNLHH